MKEYVYYLNFNCTKACPLSIPARLIYSYLAYRDRVEQGALLTTMQENLPLYESVKPALETLVEHQLVTNQDNTYRAVEPGELHKDWFVLSKKTDVKHWTERYMGHKFYFPTKKCPLSPQCLAVFCLLLDLDRQDKIVTIAGLTSMLNINASTVRRAFTTLQDAQLLTLLKLDSRNYDVIPRAIPLQCEDWFMKKKNAGLDPAWLKAIKHYHPSKRKLMRLTYLVEKLRPYYPVVAGFNPRTFTFETGFDQFMNELILDVHKAWDSEEYDSPLPLLEHRLFKRWMRLRKMEDNPGEQYKMFKYCGEQYSQEDLDQWSAQAEQVEARQRTEEEELLWR